MNKTLIWMCVCLMVKCVHVHANACTRDTTVCMPLENIRASVASGTGVNFHITKPSFMMH